MVTRQLSGVPKDQVAAIIAQFEASGCEASSVIQEDNNYTINANCPDTPATPAATGVPVAAAAPVDLVAPAIKPTARTKAK